jgi:CMP-N,N'-diacetyllegionaminic acid synthase
LKIYAVIPARSGSKGLPDKNIKLINNRPLIDYSIKFAKKLTNVDRIFCSTDSSAYAEIAKYSGAEVPFLRSEYASKDDAMEQHVLKDLRKKFVNFRIPEPDIVVWLRPTFLFRDLLDVQKCIDVLKNRSEVSATRTVIEAENRLYNIKDDMLIPTFDDNGKSMIRRQDMVNSYKVFSTDVFRFKGNNFDEDFLGKNIIPIVTNPICGMDIDNKFDFELTRLLVEEAQGVVDEFVH